MKPTYLSHLLILPLTFLSFTKSASPQELFGTTPVAGAVGDGRTSALISYEGTILTLRWPNPTFYEHINYQTGKWDEDRGKNAWLKPYYGGPENGGIFAGIQYTTGTTFSALFLRDMNRSFRYANPKSGRFLIQYEDSTGWKVLEEVFVPPEKDTLTILFTLEEYPPSVTPLSLVVVANPALNTRHGIYNPLGQTSDDILPRFGSFYLLEEKGILTALPDPVRKGELPPPSFLEELVAFSSSNPSVEEVNQWVKSHLPRWGEGVYFFQSGIPDPISYQVGTDFLLHPTGPVDAYIDLKDGVLSGNPIVSRWETTALAFPLLPTTQIVWFGTFSTTGEDLLTKKRLLHEASLEELKKETDEFFSFWCEGILLPDQGEKAKEFAYRTWISLRMGFDPSSGAIVASLSADPPYNVDWPRDGSFFQYLFLLNERYPEAVTRALFYTKIQNKGWGLYGPPGSMPMNAYADYTTGGPLDFEIDQVGLTLWTWYITGAFLWKKKGDPESALRYFREIKSSVDLAGSLLVECKDEKTKLQCPANEDDRPAFTQSLHGAITVWLGLQSASKIMALLGEERKAYKLFKRAEELKEAIQTYLSPIAPLIQEDDEPVQSYGWSLWPAFFPWRDPKIYSYIEEEMLKRLRFVFGPYSSGTIYDTKLTIALLTPPLRSPSTVNYISELHKVYLNEVLSSTLHLGEVSSQYDLDGDGKKEWVNRVATPHLWAQTLLYLSLLAETKPEILNPPEIEVSISPPTPKKTFSCGVDSRSSSSPDLLSLLLILFFLLSGTAVLKRKRSHP
jgi:hypothetical protein